MDKISLQFLSSVVIFQNFYFLRKCLGPGLKFLWMKLPKNILIQILPVYCFVHVFQCRIQNNAGLSCIRIAMSVLMFSNISCFTSQNAAMFVLFSILYSLTSKIS